MSVGSLCPCHNSYMADCKGVPRFIGAGADGYRAWACGKHKVEGMARAGTEDYKKIYMVTEHEYDEVQPPQYQAI